MTLHVLRPGMLTTVQDGGRIGLRRHGIVRGGAMDPFALRCLNVLIGNDAADAGLECTITGPELRFGDERTIAFGGYAPRVQLDGVDVPAWTRLRAGSGSTLRMHDSGPGCRIYLAISGGLDVPVALGSRATDLTAGFGGLDGRALQTGDVLPLGAHRMADDERGAAAGRSMLPRYSDAPTVRIIAAPETAWLGEAGILALESESYRVGPDSNRMGCRLDGPQLEVRDAGSMKSSAVAPGTVQLPPSGQPIVLMADAQTIGGYPRIAHVISADLPLVAQLRPGHAVRFRWVSLSDAEQLASERRRDLAMLSDALRLRSRR